MQYSVLEVETWHTHSLLHLPFCVSNMAELHLGARTTWTGAGVGDGVVLETVVIKLERVKLHSLPGTVPETHWTASA